MVSLSLWSVCRYGQSVGMVRLLVWSLCHYGHSVCQQQDHGRLQEPPARPGDDSEQDEVSHGGSIMPAPRTLSGSAHVFRGQSVLVPTLSRTHSVAPGQWSRPDPPSSPRALPEPCRQGGDHSVTWPALSRQPFPGPPSSLSPAKTQIELSVPPSVPPSTNTNHSPHQRG